MIMGIRGMIVGSIVGPVLLYAVLLFWLMNAAAMLAECSTSSPAT
jgi:hypothetical protein